MGSLAAYIRRSLDSAWTIAPGRNPTMLIPNEGWAKGGAA
jgi:hypothetical protein